MTGVNEYTALDETGREEKSFIDAVGVAAVGQKLREEGVYPTITVQAKMLKDRQCD